MLSQTDLRPAFGTNSATCFFSLTMRLLDQHEGEEGLAQADAVAQQGAVVAGAILSML